MLGGINFTPAPRWKLNTEIAWNRSEASMSMWDFEVPRQFLNANQSYDFTDTYLFSDLDLSTLELKAEIRYSFADDKWIGAHYLLSDVDDDAPYIVDYTGSLDRYGLFLGWRFD